MYNWLLSWLRKFYYNLHNLTCNQMFLQKVIILVLPLYSTETPTKQYFIQKHYSHLILHLFIFKTINSFFPKLTIENLIFAGFFGILDHCALLGFEIFSNFIKKVAGEVRSKFIIWVRSQIKLSELGQSSSKFGHVKDATRNTFVDSLLLFYSCFPVFAAKSARGKIFLCFCKKPMFSSLYVLFFFVNLHFYCFSVYPVFSELMMEYWTIEWIFELSCVSLLFVKGNFSPSLFLRFMSSYLICCLVLTQRTIWLRKQIIDLFHLWRNKVAFSLPLREEFFHWSVLRCVYGILVIPQDFLVPRTAVSSTVCGQK